MLQWERHLEHGSHAGRRAYASGVAHGNLVAAHAMQGSCHLCRCCRPDRTLQHSCARFFTACTDAMLHNMTAGMEASALAQVPSL